MVKAESHSFLQSNGSKIVVMDTSNHTSEAVVPPPDVLAFFIRFQRQMMRWKQAILASKADVSVTTIERVERGDSVSQESLEKIGNALGHPPGVFTAPRVLASDDEAFRRVVESFSWLTDTVPVKVAPLRKEPQLREILACASAFLDSDLGPVADQDLATLKEWLDFANWMVATSEGSIAPHPGRSFKKRELYSDIFAHVGMMERKYRAVCLVGTYEATSNVEMFATLRVGVFAFKSKARNPAATAIPELRAPPHLDLRKTLAEWLGATD